jgi:hypothetical protein
MYPNITASRLLNKNPMSQERLVERRLKELKEKNKNNNLPTNNTLPNKAVYLK